MLPTHRRIFDKLDGVRFLFNSFYRLLKTLKTLLYCQGNYVLKRDFIYL